VSPAPLRPPLAALLPAALLLAPPLFGASGCGDDDGPGAPDGAADAASADAGPAPPCLAPTDALMVPTPLWESDPDHLTPPEGDAAVALLRARPSWVPELSRVSGWPRRPTVVVPLWGTATTADPSAIRVFAGRGDGSLEEIELPLTAFLEDGGGTLVVVPDNALGVDLAEALFSFGAGAVTGATLMPACADGGRPHPAYAEAAARLPAGTDPALALPFRLASGDAELPALYEALAAAPALTVRSVEAVDPATLGEAAPSAAVAAVLATPIAEGLLELPAYQDADGVFAPDADGLPAAQGTTVPGFTVLLPTVGTAPYPWFLYQHGGSQHRHRAMQAVAPLLEAGFAIVAMDLPFHGDRAPAGGGTDFDILAFDDPLRSRDNLRQASADHLAVLTGTDALNTALAPILGPAVTLDPNRRHYVGLSLGGITGSLTFAAATDIQGAALFVAGGGYQEILAEGLFSLVLGDVIRAGGGARHAVLALIELLLDGADPLVYAGREALGGRTRPLLLFEAIDDPIVPNGATDRWARAFGASLALPSEHAVADMAEVALPHAADPTRLLVQAPMMELGVSERHGGLIEQDYAETLIAHCFETLGTGGTCEAIDTGWASH